MAHKICLANRGNNLLQRLDMDRLCQEGLTAIELYIGPNLDYYAEAISNYRSCLEDRHMGLVVHLDTDPLSQPKGPVDRLFQLADKLGQSPAVVVLHPSENVVFGRSDRRDQTINSLYRLTHTNWFGRLCLENLPHDSGVPDRFGDCLEEIVAVAKVTGVKTTFDTGHYFSGLVGHPDDERYLEAMVGRIGHIHINGYQEGREHWPLDPGDKKLALLVRRIRGQRPDFDGYWSIEIDADKADPMKDVLSSLQTLKNWLA